jgi:hypothetical protein
MWFRTFFLMPKWHIPWPIPRFYTIGLFQWREGCSSEPIDDFEVAVQPNSDSGTGFSRRNLNNHKNVHTVCSIPGAKEQNFEIS